MSNSLDTYFDKIYIINLKRRTDRRDFMLNQMQKYNITNFQLFEATDRYDLDIELLNKEEKVAYWGNKFFCTKTCSCKGKGHKLTIGEVGCMISHYRVCQDIIDNSYSRCLILEDDIRLNDPVNSFNNIISDIPSDWDLLYLAPYKRDLKNYHTIENNSFKKVINKGVCGAWMYGINNNTAKIFINNFFPIRAGADGYLSYFIIKQNKIKNVYACTKSIAFTGGACGDSDIGGGLFPIPD